MFFFTKMFEKWKKIGYSTFITCYPVCYFIFAQFGFLNPVKILLKSHDLCLLSRCFGSVILFYRDQSLVRKFSGWNKGDITPEINWDDLLGEKHLMQSLSRSFSLMDIFYKVSSQTLGLLFPVWRFCGERKSSCIIMWWCSCHSVASIQLSRGPLCNHHTVCEEMIKPGQPSIFGELCQHSRWHRYTQNDCNKLPCWNPSPPKAHCQFCWIWNKEFCFLFFPQTCWSGRKVVVSVSLLRCVFLILSWFCFVLPSGLQQHFSGVKK